MQPLISVIVPVYKVEPYLDSCVQSIVNQTYKNLEIILVDDGSPDNCPAMCDAWKERDSRITVIHQKNAGGAQARNAALDLAQGDFIAFVDSDDYICSEMYAHLAAFLMQGFDIAECGYMEVWNSDADFPQMEVQLTDYSTVEALKANVEDTAFRQLIWNKLYRRDVINEIRFPEGKKIDDEFFTYRVIGNAKKLVRSNRVCYAYRQQNASVMHSMGAEKRLQAIEAKQQRHTYLMKRFPELEAVSLKNLWFTGIYQGQLALRELSRENAKQALRYIEGILRSYPLQGVQELTSNFKDKVWLRLASCSLFAVCYLRNFLKIGL